MFALVFIAAAALYGGNILKPSDIQTSLPVDDKFPSIDFLAQEAGVRTTVLSASLSRADLTFDLAVTAPSGKKTVLYILIFGPRLSAGTTDSNEWTIEGETAGRLATFPPGKSHRTFTLLLDDCGCVTEARPYTAIAGLSLGFHYRSAESDPRLGVLPGAPEMSLRIPLRPEDPPQNTPGRPPGTYYYTYMSPIETDEVKNISERNLVALQATPDIEGTGLGEWKWTNVAAPSYSFDHPKVLAVDSEHKELNFFYSGILFGVGGAAIVAIVDRLFDGLKRAKLRGPFGE
ncbi:hypothetical protein [Streptomyces sp. NPDC050538]|uniref:hypothetical protein n=1 Tax=Streptomyces sp. NPDC050538 TaxID=3365627 RepID=UPI00378CE8D3